MRHSLLGLAFLATLTLRCLSPTVEAQGGRPRLVVLLVVDQMRADYIDRFQHQWTAGLKRLLIGGAHYPNAAYPFANTVTCAGHASLSTGTPPSVHGMIMNTWWDRDFGRVVACADDPSSLTFSYGKPVSAPGESGARLLVPTLADALRTDRTTAARTAAFSLKARSVVTLAGTQPSAIAWVSDQDAWVTSTAYGGLNPAVARFIDAHPVEGELWTMWERARPEAEYWYERVTPGTRGEATLPFPHPIRTWGEWQDSPLSDAYLARLALDVSAQLRLGGDARTDYLAISFSALDLVGHAFGPQSHEVQDVLIRLDETLGAFLEDLDRRVGRGNYVVALSADHGVSSIPDVATRDGLDAGRIQPLLVIRAVQAALTARLGRDRFDVRVQNGNVYLDGDVRERLSATDLDAVTDALAAVPGIARAYSWREMTHGEGGSHRATSDPLRRAVMASYDPGRSGDFVFVNRPNWLYGPANAATHGTPYEYDTRVPLILYGFGVRPGTYTRAVTPLDVAPTLARLAGVELPRAEGSVLAEAVRLPTHNASPTRR
jgi:predicted AlkP superfamily pyrophosphatase or phosphodiesterase